MPKGKEPITYRKTRGRGGQPFPGSDSSEKEEGMGDNRDASEEGVLRILSDLGQRQAEMSRYQQQSMPSGMTSGTKVSSPLSLYKVWFTNSGKPMR